MKNGLIVMDPRRQTLSRHAYKHLQFKPGSDVAMLNAMLHTIITEGLTDDIIGRGHRSAGEQHCASDAETAHSTNENLDCAGLMHISRHLSTDHSKPYTY